MDLLDDTSLLINLTIVHCVGLALTSGLALGMYSFSIPIILGPEKRPTLVMLQQFEELISRGRGYIQTASRYQGAFLAFLIYLYYRHPNLDVSNRYKLLVWALLVLVQVAWYEVVAVFPTNDRLFEIRAKLEKMQKGDVGETVEARKVRPEVLRLMQKWRWRHVPRILIPVAGLVLSIGAITF